MVSEVSVHGHVAVILGLWTQYIMVGAQGRGVLTSWRPRSKERKEGRGSSILFKVTKLLPLSLAS